MIRGDLPLRIRKVRIVGNARTRPHVVEDELQDAYEAGTLQEVYNGLVVGAEQLKNVGLFESVRVVMDAVEGSASETDVTVTVKEKNWFALKAGTTTSLEPDDSLRYSIAGMLLNVLGRGEVLDVGYNSPISALASRSFNARLAVPRILGADASFTLEALADTTDMTRHCSLMELRRGITASARTFDRVHALAAELGLRDIIPRRHPTVPYASGASISVVGDARPSVKGSVKYTYTDDRRDDPLMPTRGAYFQASAEGAGLLGDTTFAKGTFEMQNHIPLALLTSGSFSSPLSLSLCASGGAVRPLGACRRTCFSDRFELGGPMTLRGFQYFGVGPRAPKEEGGCEVGDALGGDIRYTASAALGFPFPVLAMGAAGWRGYLFTNLGNLTTWETPLMQYARDTRVSVGVGAAWNFMGAARLEINYAHVLRKSPLDVTRSLQFGFGVNFF